VNHIIHKSRTSGHSVDKDRMLHIAPVKLSHIGGDGDIPTKYFRLACARHVRPHFLLASRASASLKNIRETFTDCYI
jgi:hypothetical protein